MATNDSSAPTAPVPPEQDAPRGLPADPPPAAPVAPPPTTPPAYPTPTPSYQQQQQYPPPANPYHPLQQPYPTGQPAPPPTLTSQPPSSQPYAAPTVYHLPPPQVIVHNPYAPPGTQPVAHYPAGYQQPGVYIQQPGAPPPPAAQYPGAYPPQQPQVVHVLNGTPVLQQPGGRNYIVEDEMYCGPLSLLIGIFFFPCIIFCPVDRRRKVTYVN